MFIRLLIILMVFLNGWALSAHDLVNVRRINPSIALFGYPKGCCHPWCQPCCRCNNPYYLMKDVARKLSFVQNYLQRDGIGLILYRAYAPYEGDPHANQECVLNWENIYSRGVGVDVSLVYLDGQPLEMPSAVYSDGEESNPCFRDQTCCACHNLQRLVTAMKRFGFIQSPDHWWHFDYKWWPDYPVLDIPLENLHAESP